MWFILLQIVISLLGNDCQSVCYPVKQSLYLQGFGRCGTKEPKASREITKRNSCHEGNVFIYIYTHIYLIFSVTYFSNKNLGLFSCNVVWRDLPEIMHRSVLTVNVIRWNIKNICIFYVCCYICQGVKLIWLRLAKLNLHLFRNALCLKLSL